MAGDSLDLGRFGVYVFFPPITQTFKHSAPALSIGGCVSH